MIVNYLKLVVLGLTFELTLGGILYPQTSETRSVLTLDGLWQFSLREPADTDLDLIAVPSSYNDLTTNSSLRDYFGNVWYQKEFYVPKSWEGNRIWIRFSSVTYSAEVVFILFFFNLI